MKKVGGVRVVATVKMSPEQRRGHCYDLLAAQREGHQRVRVACQQRKDGAFYVLAEVSEHKLAGVTPPPHFTVFDGIIWANIRGSMSKSMEVYEVLGRGPMREKWGGQIVSVTPTTRG